MAPPRWRADQWPSAGLEDLQAPGNPQDIPVGPRGLRTGRVRPMDLPGGVPTAPVFDEADWCVLNGSLVFTLTNANQPYLILPRPSDIRNFLMLRNPNAAANLYVNFGAPVLAAQSLLQIVAGNHALWDKRIPQDDVYAVTDTAGATIVIGRSSTPGNPVF